MLRQKGYSLIEAIACLLLASVLTLNAIPAMQEMLNRSEAQSAANLMLIRVQQARSLAAQRGRIIAICSGIEQCTGQNTWQRSLLLFEDVNGNGQRESDERIVRQEMLPERHRWFWSSFRRKPYLQLQPDGSTLALNGTLTLCQTGQPTFQLIIGLGGRPRIRDAPQEPSVCH